MAKAMEWYKSSVESQVRFENERVFFLKLIEFILLCNFRMSGLSFITFVIGSWFGHVSTVENGNKHCFTQINSSRFEANSINEFFTRPTFFTQESRWSKCFYAYQKAAIMCMIETEITPDQKKEQIELMR